MKKAVLIFTFLVISLISYGQKRVNVPGTKVWMVLPDGATLGKDFIGVQVNKNTRIFVTEQKGESFYDRAKNLNREYFERGRVKVYDYQEFKLSDYPAKLLWVDGALGTKAYQLAFGDSTFSTFVLGIYEENDEETGKKIKKALLSIKYKK